MPPQEVAAVTAATAFGAEQLDDDGLVTAARSGDVSAIDELLRRYTAYTRAKARTYFLIGADREDIVQEGMIGLFKAIRDFDIDKAMSFRSFAELCITRQIITAIKAATRRKHVPLNSYVSLHKPVATEDEGERQLSDFLASARAFDPVELVVAEDEVEHIRAFLLTILSDLEAEVLQMYLSGSSYQTIAEKLERQAKSIDNALQRIKRKLEVFLREREVLVETETRFQRVVHVTSFRAGGDRLAYTDPAVAAAVSTKAAGRRVNGRAPATNGRSRAAASRASRASRSSTRRTNGRLHKSQDLRAGLRFAVAAAVKASKAPAKPAARRRSR